MRIGLIYHDLVQNAGGPRQVICLGRELQKLGYRVSLYCYRYAPERCFPELCSPLDVRPVEIIRRDREPERPLGAVRQLHRYYAETREIFRRMDQTLEVLNPHERPAHRAAAYHKSRTGAPIVWMFNDPTTWELGDVNRPRNPIVNLLKNFIMYPQEKKLLREIDQVTVLDTRVQRILQECYGIEARVVRTGLDHLRFRVKNQNNLLRPKYDIPSSALLALWAGVLFPHRRLEDLVRSVRILRDRSHDMRALIVGSASQAPEYFANLQNLVTELGLKGCVLFVPTNVSEEQLAGYYQSTDVFVFPNDQQTWGLAPLEAMACGKPVVVSKGSGVHEVLRDHETALLVPPRNPAAIAAALEQLILDPGLRHRLGQAGYHFVRDTLSWEKYAQQMAEIFEIAANLHQSRHFVGPPRQQKREARACL